MTTKKITTIILLLFFWTSSFSADLYKSTTTLNVRSGPGTNYQVVFSLHKGDEVKVLSKINGWSEIEYSGNTGYASSKYLDPVITTEESNNETNQFFSTSSKFLLIIAVFIIILIVLAFVFKRGALKNYGSIISLLATCFYFFLGLFLNLLFIGNLGENSSLAGAGIGGGMIISILTYFLAIVVGILSIIGFFKNIGIGIIILSAIIALTDFYTGAIPGAIMASMALFGGILNTIGYSQIKNKWKSFNI